MTSGTVLPGPGGGTPTADGAEGEQDAADRGTAATAVSAPPRALPAQHQAPLLEAVRREARTALARMHGPGHQGGARASGDVTALLGSAALTADVGMETSQLDRARRAAEALAAQAWGAGTAWLLGNGATGGNLAWLTGTLRDGDEVIVGRDAHLSVLTGLALSGARPVWVVPRLHPRHGLPLGIAVADVERALDRHPRARAVLVTTPGYAATCADVTGIVALARARGVLSFVDQAWGAHLAFHPRLPPDAIAVGADGAVVSLHKSGTALSSGAVLLASARVGEDIRTRVTTAVRMTQTSSPLLPLLASVDAARRDLAVGGVEAVEGALERARWLAGRVRGIPGLRVIGADELGLGEHLVDPLRLVVDVTRLGLTGWEVETALRHLGAPPQGADDRKLYFTAGAVEGRPARTGRGPEPLWPGGVLTARALEQVARRALDHEVAPRRRQRRSARGATIWQTALAPGEQALTPREAGRAPAVAVPLRAAAGRVAAEPVVPYPPGVPVLMPGEVITTAVVESLRTVLATGGHVRGWDPGPAAIRVVDV